MLVGPDTIILMTITVAVFASCSAAFRCHHAGLGLDLEGTVYLEVAPCDDQFTFLQAVADDVVVSSAGAKHDLPPLEAWLLSFRDLDDTTARVPVTRTADAGMTSCLVDSSAATGT